MNDFALYDFRISNISFCTLVKAGTGQPIHKNRPSHGFVMQISGTKRYIFDDGPILTVKEGDVFYLPIGSNYRVETVSEGECYVVNFEIIEQGTAFPAFALRPSRPEVFREHFETILFHYQKSLPGGMNRCFSLLYTLVCDIQTEIQKGYIPSRSRRMVQGAIDFIFQNIDDPDLTVQRIADHLGVSPEHFRRIFASVTHLSPRRYIIQSRMTKAKELLLSREFSVNEITHLCGYAGECYFSAEFKRYFGVSPTRYGENEE